MAPGLLPGDWLLVDPDAFRSRPPQPDDLVVVPDPRAPARLLIKRVEAVLADRRLALGGDRAEASTDFRTFGPVEASKVSGRPWFRYWPLRRMGRLR